MSHLPFCSAADAGLNPARWAFATGLLQRLCRNGTLPAAAMIAGRGDQLVLPVLCGSQSLDSPLPVRNDAMFLVASITKPVVAMAALQLVERGLLTLSDKVIDYVPEFGRHGKNGVRVRHLLTHTSGLPDMLPDNIDLRRRHAPLSEFVAGTCETTLDFAPGSNVRYQSMGFAVLGEIISRITGQPCANFVRTEIFQPLGMVDSWLGVPAAWYDNTSPELERIVEIRVPDEQAGADWNWNSHYWRCLGAPWGGLLTTPADLAAFCRMMLGHAPPGADILSKSAIHAATRNQLAVMPDVPEVERRTKPWGLGWRLDWPAHSANFGDFPGPRTYGHWGATGTVLWIDPDLDAFFVLLTTCPQEPHGTWLARVSNAATAAFS